MRIFVFILMTILVRSAAAQYFNIPASSSASLAEIYTLADEHFGRTGKGRGTGYKQYQRWVNEMEIKTDRSGRVLNYEVLTEKANSLLPTNQNLSRSAHGQWICEGPYDLILADPPSGGHGLGRINCMAFHPTNPDIFWVGAAAGGLWKTTDGAETWTPYLDGMAPISVSDIVVRPDNPDVLFILTGDGDGANTYSSGIKKSTDGGIHWVSNGPQFTTEDNIRGYRLVHHPLHPDTIVMCTDKGIYYTKDGGNNWQQPGFFINKCIFDAEFSLSGNRLLIAGINACYYTDNMFLSTTTIGDPDLPSNPCRKSIATSPSEPNHIYVVCGGVPDTGVFNGIYKSTNNGLDFDLQANTPNILGRADNGLDTEDQSNYDLSLHVDPADDDNIFVGSIDLWKSTDSGVTWTKATWNYRSTNPERPFVHADWHNSYSHGGSYYACGDGGLYVLAPGETEWVDITIGIAINQYYNIDVRHGKAIGGLQDNGTLEMIFPSSAASEIGGGDGFGCTYHAADPTISFMSTQSSVSKKDVLGYETLMAEENGFWYTKLWLATSHDEYIFFTKEKTLLYGNHTLGEGNFQWKDMNTASSIPDGQKIRGFAQGKSNPNVGYLVNSHHLIKSTNLNATTPIWVELNTPNDEAVFTDVIVSPDDHNRIWITCGSYVENEKVYFSPDGGMSWTNLSGALPNIPIRCITLDTSSTNESIYIGTELGVMYRNASLSEWINFSTYFPRVIVNELVIYNNSIYAGTYGRGIWKSDLYACPTALNLTPGNDPIDPENLGYQEFRASSHITSTRVIGGSFSDVNYAAGNYIDLKVGFLAKEKGSFKAIIEGCPD